MAKKQPQGPSGLMVIDKPAGMSSHDVVSRMRRIAGTRRVGHAGTLDPAATGVLILGVNKATKLLTYLVGQDKTYDATIRLGIETLTEDAEGEHTAAHPEAVEALTAMGPEQMRARILEAVAGLRGDIMQVPSAVSAIKINGVRSYARVRGGEEVELPARPVTISEFTVHSVTAGFAEYVVEDLEGEHMATSVPVVDCEVTVSCSSGTYIRALARDLGKILGTGGHLTALRRTRVGAVVLEDAADLAQLKQRREESEAPLEDLPLLPLEEAAPMEPVFKEMDIIIPSMRMDAVIHTVYKLSRSEAAAFVKAEKVKLNHQPVSKPSVNVKEGDVVSVRTKGRFVVDAITGSTKKGNLKLHIKKFS